jgi:hypothetical protein
MTPTEPEIPGVEPDGRFPSGPWTGYFLQPSLPGKQWMELLLTFREGIVQGEGRDVVGKFLIKGKYQVDDGKCWWTKAYVKKHSIAYLGYNEGKGIWGTWEYHASWKGGFYIWPVAMGDPTQVLLAEAIEEPVSTLAPVPPIAEPVTVPAEVAEPALTSSGTLGPEMPEPSGIRASGR